MTDLEEWNRLCILGQMDVMDMDGRGLQAGFLTCILLFRWVRVENLLFQRYVLAKARSSYLLSLYCKRGKSFCWKIQNYVCGFVLYMCLYVLSADILYR